MINYAYTDKTKLLLLIPDRSGVCVWVVLLTKEMCDTVFAFAENDGYHFETPSLYVYANLPLPIATLLAQNEIATIYCLAFGTDGAFVISYRGNLDGLDHLQTANIPTRLRAFLYETRYGGLVRNLDKLKVSFGTSAASYYATDGSSWVWDNLPLALQTALTRRRSFNGVWLDPPRLVSLGTSGDFILLTDGDECSMRLTRSPVLRDMLNAYVGAPESAGAFRCIHNLALNAHSDVPDTWVVQSSDGQVFFSNPPPNSSHVTLISSRVLSDTHALRQQQQQQQQQQAEAFRAEQSLQMMQIQTSAMLAEERRQVQAMYESNLEGLRWGAEMQRRAAENGFSTIGDGEWVLAKKY